MWRALTFFLEVVHMCGCVTCLSPLRRICVKLKQEKRSIGLESKERRRLVTLLCQRQERKKDGIHHEEANSTEPPLRLSHTHTRDFYLCEDSLGDTFLSPQPDIT